MSINILEKRVTDIGGVATADEYVKLGEAAIKHQTYADLPSDLQKLLTTLEAKATSQSKKAVQEQKVAVKSGNPYRQAGGRFGSGGEATDGAEAATDQMTVGEFKNYIADYPEMQDDVVKSLKGYQQGAGMALNVSLQRRHEKNTVKLSDVETKLLSDLSGAMDQHKLKSDLTLHRGINMEGVTTGKIFRHGGFISTTLNRDSGVEFATDYFTEGTYSPNVLVIKAKKGQRGIFPARSTNAMFGEQEFILPAGGSLTVGKKLKTSNENGTSVTFWKALYEEK